jgi:hypothetical protein
MNVVVKRIKKPTPKFFKKLRAGSLTLAAISAAIFASPVALPAILIKVAGYLAVAGGVAGAVCQTAVKNEKQ